MPGNSKMSSWQQLYQTGSIESWNCPSKRWSVRWNTFQHTVHHQQRCHRHFLSVYWCRCLRWSLFHTGNHVRHRNRIRHRHWGKGRQPEYGISQGRWTCHQWPFLCHVRHGVRRISEKTWQSEVLACLLGRVRWSSSVSSALGIRLLHRHGVQPCGSRPNPRRTCPTHCGVCQATWPTWISTRPTCSICCNDDIRHHGSVPCR